MKLTNYETILLDNPAEYVLRATINRPEVYNAMNTQMGKDLLHLVKTQLPELGLAVRCLVFTGAGSKAFGAGGDLKERKGMTDAQWQAQHVIFEDGIFGIMDLPMPTIAAVNGIAMGGGCELALACDFIYAARSARFALPEITLGIFPGAGGTQNLPRAVGTRRAKELILTGNHFSPDEALQWGMINKVCDDDQLMPEVLKTAGKIASNGPLAVKLAKQSISSGIEMDLKNALKQSIALYNHTANSKDRREGVLAFNEKRKANFTGE
ncbi:MAG: enoyl-CoA hydratase/isomerase family protein [Candidatus Lambdaproteobacteria bacterium]|nr:enoyl-CoA hydratase/isomerase family protein [Candidatus Lambdaproteobacteria bacterium]